ncbi:MAG: hypothetical protein ACSHWW_05040 [Nonlabens sp.]|uniref:hypothetical protein n=1 Tax=Nonlabens sp. TaxID=1888209 RepID=UPI003EF9E7AB
MTKDKVLDDLKEIRSIMDKSTRFISLSGMSGVMAGIYALIGSVVGYCIINDAGIRRDTFSYEKLMVSSIAENHGMLIILVAGIVALLSIVTAFLLTQKKARKHKQSIWSSQTKRLVAHFAIPLFTGGVIVLVLLQYKIIGLVAPAMLIFYGLACVNASKYTIGTVLYLGLTCIALGLINTQFIGYGLYFWAAGFGICHIVYGAVMYYKYDR